MVKRIYRWRKFMSRSSESTVQLGCVAAALYGETILFDIVKLCHKIVCYGYGSGCPSASFWKCVRQSAGLQRNSAIMTHSAMAKTFSEKFSISFSFECLSEWVRWQGRELLHQLVLENGVVRHAVSESCCVLYCGGLSTTMSNEQYMQNTTRKLIRAQRCFPTVNTFIDY